MAGTIKIALIGAGMFGSDVHLRAYANLQLAGIGAQLGRVGLGDWARERLREKPFGRKKRRRSTRSAYSKTI